MTDNTIDLSEYVEGLAPGEYDVNIVDAQGGTWSTGTPYIRWQLSVFNNADPRFNGLSVFHKTPSGGKGVGFLVELYKAATKGEKPESGTTVNAVAQKLLGKQLSIILVEGHDREGNLSGFMEVKKVKPYKG